MQKVDKKKIKDALIRFGEKFGKLSSKEKHFKIHGK